MKPLAVLFLALWVAVATSWAVDEPHYKPADLTDAQKASALAFLKSNRENKREAGYSAFRRFGDDGKPLYKTMLEQAREHHQSELAQAARNSGAGVDSRFSEALRDWKDQRDETMAFLKIDHKKDPGKISQLDAMYDDTERLMKKLERFLRRGANPLDRLMETADALVEIERELAWCNDDRAPRNITVEDLLREFEQGQNLLKSRGEFEERLRAKEAFEAANEYNKSLPGWAGRQLTGFAQILNYRRYVLGLKPLLLDERLSAAADQHSTDMKQNGYFAHSTPDSSSEYHTPGQRTRMFDFEGSFAGENIYMGSAAPADAFRAWWKSDGHRFIMFASGPNSLGLGISGSHWTLMTGNKRRKAG